MENNILEIKKRIESLGEIDSFVASFENLTIDDMEDEIIFDIEKCVHAALEFYSNKKDQILVENRQIKKHITE